MICIICKSTSEHHGTDNRHVPWACDSCRGKVKTVDEALIELEKAGWPCRLVELPGLYVRVGHLLQKEREMTERLGEFLRKVKGTLHNRDLTMSKTLEILTYNCGLNDLLDDYDKSKDSAP